MNKKQCVYVSAGLLGAGVGSLAFLLTAIVTAVAMIKGWPRGAFVALLMGHVSVNALVPAYLQGIFSWIHIQLRLGEFYFVAL